MNSKLEELISKKVKIISLKNGLGHLVGKFPMYDGIDDYLEVLYLFENKSEYISMKNLSDLRLVSPKQVIEDELFIMNKKLNNSEIENNLNKLKRTFLEKDISSITFMIVDFFRKDKLSNEENFLLEAFINTLIIEVQEGYDINQDSAQGIVSDYLKSA